MKHLKERNIELTGEAYFEVVRNTEKPFIVKTSAMSVMVTGTQFNVMAYSDEKYTATTLVEGSVNVSNNNSNMVLRPGEQVVSNEGAKLSKNIVDVEQNIAWKNGLFQFSNSDIRTVMNQISRWYDVTIEYQASVPEKHFGGYISRDSKLSQVLKILDPEQRVQLMYDYTKSRKENAKFISFEKFISMDRIDK